MSDSVKTNLLHGKTKPTRQKTINKGKGQKKILRWLNRSLTPLSHRKIPKQWRKDCVSRGLIKRNFQSQGAKTASSDRKQIYHHRSFYITSSWPGDAILPGKAKKVHSHHGLATLTSEEVHSLHWIQIQPTELTGVWVTIFLWKRNAYCLPYPKCQTPICCYQNPQRAEMGAFSKSREQTTCTLQLWEFWAPAPEPQSFMLHNPGKLPSASSGQHQPKTHEDQTWGRPFCISYLTVLGVNLHKP